MNPEPTRLVLLGFDGMDHALTLRLLPRLPNLRRLSEQGCFLPLESVFPPDSIPAWITAYTGLPPSEHGILESVNYFAKGDDRLRVDTSAFRGRTFWDAVGASGRTVCVLNPFLGYPVWPVNGLMVNGPVFINGEVQASDPAWVEGLQVPQTFGGIVDFPTRKTIGRFVEKTFADTREQAAFGQSILEQRRPDLFFQTFLTSDRIQHFLWRYGDPDDPAYPGPSCFEKVIEEFYGLIDTIVGGYLDRLAPGDRLAVLSDHGHGMRCTHCFNINEYLRRRGDLAGRRGVKARAIEFGKNAFLAAMDRLGLQDHVRTIARFVPGASAIKKGKHSTDAARNRAWVSDFTGTNPFGGICINRDLVEDAAIYREALISELSKLKWREKPVFEWIRPREECVEPGSNIERFPEILFEMQPSLGINWALYTPLFTRNPTHKSLSGGHRREGVWFANSPDHVGTAFPIRDLYRWVIKTFDMAN